MPELSSTPWAPGPWNDHWTVEWHMSCQALIQHAPERVDVAPGIEDPALDLLRRHVVERADERLGVSETGRDRHGFREPEVDEKRVLVAAVRTLDEHIARL